MFNSTMLFFFIAILNTISTNYIPTDFQQRTFFQYQGDGSGSTSVFTNTRLIQCVGKVAKIYRLCDGSLERVENYTIGEESSLKIVCLDAFQNDTYVLFKMGFQMIRHNLVDRTNKYKGSGLGQKTYGKLALAGQVFITNTITTGQLLIGNFENGNNQLIAQDKIGPKNFQIEVSPNGVEFTAFYKNQIFYYAYIQANGLWHKVYKDNLPVGSVVNWLTYSPMLDCYYHNSLAYVYHKRISSNYSIQSNVAVSTQLTIIGMQYISEDADQFYMQRYNATTQDSFGFIKSFFYRDSSLHYPARKDFQNVKINMNKKLMFLTYPDGVELYDVNDPQSSTQPLKCEKEEVKEEVKEEEKEEEEEEEVEKEEEKEVLQFSESQQKVLGFSTTLYSAPTLRQSLKFFSFMFLAIDNIWLYQYHNRTYGKEINQVFAAVKRIEDMKFAFFTTFQIGNEILTNTEMEIQILSNYSLYSNPKYLKIQGKDSSFVINTIDFFIFNIPGTLMSFALLRYIFFKISKYKVSTFIRVYAFWGYFFVCLVVPNMEYFAFLLGNQFQLGFFMHFVNKMLCCAWILCLFSIILFGAGMVFFMKYFYRKRSKLFLENVYRIKWSYFWIVFTMFIKRMITGIAHSYMYRYPYTQIMVLLSAEISQMLLMIWLFVKQQIFIEKVGVCASLCMNLNIIVFQISIIAKSYTDSQKDFNNIIDKCMVTCVISLFGITLAFSFLSALAKIFSPPPIYAYQLVDSPVLRSSKLKVSYLDQRNQKVERVQKWRQKYGRKKPPVKNINIKKLQDSKIALCQQKKQKQSKNQIFDKKFRSSEKQYKHIKFNCKELIRKQKRTHTDGYDYNKWKHEFKYMANLMRPKTLIDQKDQIVVEKFQHQ